MNHQLEKTTAETATGNVGFSWRLIACCSIPLASTLFSGAVALGLTSRLGVN